MDVNCIEGKRNTSKTLHNATEGTESLAINCHDGRRSF